MNKSISAISKEIEVKNKYFNKIAERSAFEDLMPSECTQRQYYLSYIREIKRDCENRLKALIIISAAWLATLDVLSILRYMNELCLICIIGCLIALIILGASVVFGGIRYGTLFITADRFSSASSIHEKKSENYTKDGFLYCVQRPQYDENGDLQYVDTYDGAGNPIG